MSSLKMLRPGENLRTSTKTYEITSQLGSGSYGTVYSAVDEQNREYAIKVAIDAHDRQLKNENCIYSILSEDTERTTSMGVPKTYDYFHHRSHPIFIMELLGSSLRTKAEAQDGKLSLKSCLMAGSQLLSRLEHIHEAGYLHRDIKPDNILTGRKGHHSRRLYVVDFGLGKRYREESGRHYERREGGFAGTIRYAGVNVLSGMRASRKDDLESLGYSLVELLKGDLPWGRVRKDVEEEEYKSIILEWKKRITPQELGEGFPGMERYSSYVRGLDFCDRPKYSFLKRCFEAGLSSIGEQDDGAFDWY